MARIIYTALVAGIKGSLNGSVIQSSSGGDQIRTRTRPFNPRSNKQGGMRNNFSDVIKRWSLITQAQRNTWASRNQYVQQNLWLNAAVGNFAPANGTATTPMPFPLETVVLTENQMTVRATGIDTTVPIGQALILYATEPLNPGIQQTSESMFKIIRVFPQATDLFNQVSVFNDYVAVFNELVQGHHLFIRTRIVDITYGQSALAVNYRGDIT